MFIQGKCIGYCFWWSTREGILVTCYEPKCDNYHTVKTLIHVIIFEIFWKNMKFLSISSLYNF